MMPSKVVVFDLDDTLYKEIDFLKSAYHEIARTVNVPEAYEIMIKAYLARENAFEKVIENCSLSQTVADLLKIYRNHKPSIFLSEDACTLLKSMYERSIRMGIISDGRNTQQWNKIYALHLLDFIDREDILISEETGYPKPAYQPYLYFMRKYPGAQYVYVGDNLRKDFIAPNMLGWVTFCLKDNGVNIHSQAVEVPEVNLPSMMVDSLAQIVPLV